MTRLLTAGASPQRKGGPNGKKGRTSAGAMNLLANAAEDNEAYEGAYGSTLTQAQLHQLQQHLLQQQFQVSSCMPSAMAPMRFGTARLGLPFNTEHPFCISLSQHSDQLYSILELMQLARASGGLP